jgi:hypothetical protein
LRSFIVHGVFMRRSGVDSSSGSGLKETVRGIFCRGLNMRFWGFGHRLCCS